MWNEEVDSVVISNLSKGAQQKLRGWAARVFTCSLGPAGVPTQICYPLASVKLRLRKGAPYSASLLAFSSSSPGLGLEKNLPVWTPALPQLCSDALATVLSMAEGE